MNLQYLRSFYATVQLNSISKAAKELHLTQPGLSMQIQALEKDLGVSLLNRSNKGVELTEAGQIVYDYADTIISLQLNIERDLNNLKDNKKTLTIGSCKAIGEYALPCSIYNFKYDNKDLDIQFEVSSTKEVIDNLLNRSINIGIVHGPINNDKIVSDKIVSDKLLLVTSLPIIKESICLEELKRLPIIVRECGSGVRTDVKKQLLKKNISLDDLNIVYQLNSMEGIKSCVISGKGLSFVPEMTIKKELRNETLKNIEIEDVQISSDYYVIYRKGHSLSPYEVEFIKFIKSSKRGFC